MDYLNSLHFFKKKTSLTFPITIDFNEKNQIGKPNRRNGVLKDSEHQLIISAVYIITVTSRIINIYGESQTVIKLRTFLDE